jgi:FecR protein
MITDKPMLASKAAWFILSMALAALLGWGPAPAAAQSIGKATAVRNQVQGIRGSATRKLGAGGSVFSDDTVKAGDNSLAQLLFVDQTTFTVAADSEAVLHSVYHGRTGVAGLVMRAVAGAFRFVSGVQSSRNYQIQFPQGYVAVRGTIVDILAGPDHSVIIVDQGAVTVHVYATGANYDLTAGQMLVVHAGGRTDGPMTTDATLMRGQANIPFPLFGSVQWPGQQQFPGQIEAMDLKADLNAIANTSRSSSSVVNSGACPPGLVQYFFPNGAPYCSTP